jgi:hypothetical protein
MILTNCNCGEKVNCGCVLSFSNYIQDSISVLDVGTLEGGNCSFDEYVIDWYRDGEHALVSGYGSDPGIEAYHPFTGEAAIPVPGGTWIPVLRYVIFQGTTEKVFNKPVQCKKWCKFDSSNLPTITISSLYCGLIGTGVNTPSSYYDYKIAYKTTQDYSLAARKVFFTLDSDAYYFAFYFAAYVVADRLKIFHSSDLNTPLVDIIVGTEQTTHDVESVPKQLDISDVKQFIVLPEYTAGDYLVIEITPSVISSNTSTEWDLNLKCLPQSTHFEVNSFNDSIRAWDEDTWTLTFDAVNCEFILSWEHRLSVAKWATTYLDRYAGGSWTAYHVSVNNNQVSADDNYASASMGNRTTGSYGSKIDSNANINLSKLGNVLTIQCNNQTDYNDLKAGYTNLMSGTWFSDWVDDNTKIEYYRYWQVNWRIAPVQCGDNETYKILYIFIDSDFVWDDVNLKVTITLKSISNGLSDTVPCSTVSSSAATYVGYINNTYNAADYSIDTMCRYTYPFGAGAWKTINVTTSSSYWIWYYYWLDYEYSCGLPLSGTWGAAYPNRFMFTITYLLYVVTASKDEFGSFTEDPQENFQVWARWNAKTGGGANSTNILIYEIENGIETTKLSWEDYINALP